VPDDHVAALAVDSRRAGTRGGELDYALLLDGLAAEREQGITIDVAYRYFATARRSFIVADTPGHEQYTRNMVTGASTADCAVLLLDARKGVLTQTRRHLFLATLLGVHHVALAVNKMDLVGFSPERFAEIEGELRALAAELGIEELTCIPVCAVDGDNVVSPSERTPWYEGPTVLGYLETVEVDQERMARAPFRMPVQLVLRPDAEFRGFAGTVGGGTIRPGDRVRVLPSGLESTVARIVTFDGDLECAVSGQAVTLTLADEIDVSRGDVLAAPADPPAVADQLRATVVWMAEPPMLRGRSYLLRLGTAQATATAAPIKHKVDVATMHHLAANRLELNEIGAVDLELDRPLAFDPYRENRETGGFILVDRVTNDTVGAGMLDFALRRGANLRWQPVEVDKHARAALKAQRPCVVWLTGRPSAGKSTIANLVERELLALGHHTYLLDGDNVRHGLTKDLGFTSADRVENIRRVAEVARLMTDAGLIAIVSFISPFRSERRMARDLVEAGEFLEVFVDAPLDVAEARDPKGLYAKARRGELRNFTGIDSPYEPPEAPELRIDTTALTPAAAAARVVAALRDRGVIT
jgi:bifunctional enzyme CysN/CysC